MAHKLRRAPATRRPCPMRYVRGCPPGTAGGAEGCWALLGPWEPCFLPTQPPRGGRWHQHARRVSPLPRLLTDRTPPVGAPCTVCARTSWGSDRTERPLKPLPLRSQSLPCVRQQLRLEHTKPGTLGGKMCVINVVFRTAGETLSSGRRAG